MSMVPVLAFAAVVGAFYMLVHKIQVQQGAPGLVFGQQLFQTVDQLCGTNWTPVPGQPALPIAPSLPAADASIQPPAATDEAAPGESKQKKTKGKGKTDKKKKSKQGKSKKGDSAVGSELQTADETGDDVGKTGKTGKKKTKKSKKKEKAAEAPL